RAALAIRDSIAEEAQLQVRIAVTTGEALVTIGAPPSEGEGLAAGDVVNTAARLQNTAPVNGILVDETTYRATRQAIEYREAESELSFWRQGRSLPYGEGVTYWAIAEMAKAHAGILETDTSAEAERKLVESVADLAPGRAERILDNLRPLVGLGAEADSRGD